MGFVPAFNGYSAPEMDDDLNEEERERVQKVIELENDRARKHYEIQQEEDF
jgi:hypothetical protein